MNARDILAKARATDPDDGTYYGHDHVDEARADAYIAALRAAAGGDTVVILPDGTVGRLVPPEEVDWRALNAEQWERGIRATHGEDGEPLASFAHVVLKSRAVVELPEETP